MLFFILSFIVLFAGILIAAYSDCRDGDELLEVGASVITISLLAITVILTLVIAENVHIKEKIAEDKVEHDAIVWALESEDEYMHTSVVSSLIDYNKKVIKYKTYCDSPWIGWFYNSLRAEALEYIDVEDFS